MTTNHTNRRKRYLQELKDNFGRHSRSTAILYLVLTAIVLVVLVVQLIRKNYENCFTCVLTLLLFFVPVFLERTMKITLPNTLEVIIILFIFSAEILGEIQGFYLKVRWWDTMLHTANGFLMAAVGVSMIDIFNRSERFKFELSPFFVALVAFCFSMTIGVLWEFFEFFMDFFAKTDMQKDTLLQSIATVDLNAAKENIPVFVEGIESIVLSGRNLSTDGVAVSEQLIRINGYLDIGLVDTVLDLLVNFIGAFVFSVIGFFYCRSHGKRPFAKRFLPRLQKSEGDKEAE